MNDVAASHTEDRETSASLAWRTLPRWGASVGLMLLLSVLSVLWIRHAMCPAPPVCRHHEFVVCIDPGHPTSYSPGKHVSNGVTEMQINWEVALKLEALLSDKPNVQVVKTREVQDQLMNNPERAQVANAAHADLFIRLHCDAGANHGFTLYYPNRQGEDLGVTGPSWSVIEASRHAAYIIHAGMADVLDHALKDRGVKPESFTKVGRSQGALTGSIFSQVPVVTVEMVFLNNRYDANFIKSEAGQERMARALANGVMNYLGSLPEKN